MKGLLSRALTLATALFQRQALVWDGTCSTGIHMIVARGSTEPDGYGRIGVVAQNASLLIPNSSIATVVYPATFENYFTSYAAGASEFEKLVLQYVDACPDSKVALLGFSQGAHAMMDAVCGNSDDGFFVSPEFQKALGSQGRQNLWHYRIRKHEMANIYSKLLQSLHLAPLTSIKLTPGALAQAPVRACSLVKTSPLVSHTQLEFAAGVIKVIFTATWDQTGRSMVHTLPITPSTQPSSLQRGSTALTPSLTSLQLLLLLPPHQLSREPRQLMGRQLRQLQTRQQPVPQAPALDRSTPLG